MQRSSEFLTKVTSDTQAEATKVIRSVTTLREVEADYERPLKQREAARVSTNTKLSVTNKMTQPLVTPLVVDRMSIEEALTRFMDRMGGATGTDFQQNECTRERERERAREREREIVSH